MTKAQEMLKTINENVPVFTEFGKSDSNYIITIIEKFIEDYAGNNDCLKELKYHNTTEDLYIHYAKYGPEQKYVCDYIEYKRWFYDIFIVRLTALNCTISTRREHQVNTTTIVDMPFKIFHKQYLS